jgi:hypothetical protein
MEHRFVWSNRQPVYGHSQIRKVPQEAPRNFRNGNSSTAGGPSFTLSEPFSAKNIATLSGLWLHHTLA